MTKQQIPLQQAREQAQLIVDLLRPHCTRIEIAGSIRREKPTIGDIEIVAQPREGKPTFADELLAKGVFFKRHAWGDRAKFGTYNDIPFDLFVSLSDRQFACTYWLRTGSAEANRLMVTQWYKGGILPDSLSFCAEQFWQLPEPVYNLDQTEYERCKKRGDLTPLGGEIVLVSEERDLFALVDLPFMPPQFRDERAYRMLAGRQLVSVDDIAHLWDERAGRWRMPELLYIGREIPNFAMPRSKWANPFRITQDTPENRAAAITDYRQYIQERLSTGELNLDELRGKILVCWCADYDQPKPCHGDVLLELLGDQFSVKPSVVTPSQTSMFSQATLRELEFRAAQRQEAELDEAKPKRARDEEHFEWRVPWLDASGKVWVHVGYGEYQLLSPASPRAMNYLAMLQSFDYPTLRAHLWRLEAHLVGLQKPAGAPFIEPKPPILATPMKALSLWNPWAMFVMRSLKRNETRHWQTSYRGKLVIHAAKRWTNSEKEWLDHFVEELQLDVSPGSPYWSLMHEKTYFGVALGTVELVDIIPTEHIRGLSRTERMLGNYDYNRFVWKLENPQWFEQPIPCAGHQSLWDWKAA